MEVENIIIELLRENRDDTKEILRIMPTLQTKKDCETIRNKRDEKKEKKEEKKEEKKTGNLKYIITTFIALAFGLAGTIVGVINLIH